MHRYEWKGRGSAHIHGFIWLPNAPDMETLDWENATKVDKAKDFFDQFISTWNTRDNHQQAPFLPHSDMLDPCLLSTVDIKKKTLFKTIQNYSIASKDTQNAQQIHASEKRGLPTHVVIMPHGLYKTHLPCSLIPMAKKHTNQLAMMIV